MMNQNNMNMNQNMNMMNQNNMNMNQNMNMMNQNNMNMMNQNNMNMMNQNNMNIMNRNMNMMNQNNMNMMNQNNMNMNMMNQNNMRNFNNSPPNNMNINNNKYNMGMNNMFNMNMPNVEKFDQKNFLMEKLYNQYKFEEDPFLIQKGIALGLNNNQPYKMYIAGGNQSYDFLTKSSNDGIQNNSYNKINIIFCTMRGSKHSRTYNPNDKIIDALESFLMSVGVSKNALSKICFLYNATNLNNLDKKMTLNDFKIRDNAKINVTDLHNIIGA